MIKMIMMTTDVIMMMIMAMKMVTTGAPNFGFWQKRCTHVTS